LENMGVARLPDRQFWLGKRVLITGHNGFKGSWLSTWLSDMGALVCGISLPQETEPSLFQLLNPLANVESEELDIRNFAALQAIIERFKPEIVFHMAAQALVRRSYNDPLNTLATNVMGTANVLEAARGTSAIKAVLVITTDKVYRNAEEGRAFIESDPLGGSDPYSASKAAAEIVTYSWAKSFTEKNGIAVSTARAGNVIGGGDWSEDRLIPDVWRALKLDKPLELRYPNATRPWQHVLEPLCGYLLYAESLFVREKGLPFSLNFGPAPGRQYTVSQVAETIAKAMGASHSWVPAKDVQFHEMSSLALDASLATKSLGWKPVLDPDQTLAWTAHWYQQFGQGADAHSITLEQIRHYCSGGPR
jgi:CDP-glucose 4,6-dehydratase